MHAWILSVLLLILTTNINAGNDQIKAPRKYKKLNRGETELLIINSQEEPCLSYIIKTRNEIWKNSALSKSIRHEKILELYEESVDLLETAQDYIILLSDTAHLAPTTDLFINKHLKDFLNQSPTFDQIIKLESCTQSTKNSLFLKNAGLNLVQAPIDFLKLTVITFPAGKEYKILMTDFIKNNLIIFKNTNPVINNIISLRDNIFKLQINVGKTIDALINLKKTFIDSFTDTELIKLLEYGCISPTLEYKIQLNELLEKHIKKMVEKNNTDFNYILKLDSINFYEHKKFYAKEYALTLVKSPEDFIKLAKTNINPSDYYKRETTYFIKSNLAIFKNTHPTIDHIIKLQTQLFSLQVDPESTAAALIKLKELFIQDFVGTDLIRLLSCGCENPTKEYRSQITALKNMHDIKF